MDGELKSGYEGIFENLMEQDIIEKVKHCLNRVDFLRPLIQIVRMRKRLVQEGFNHRLHLKEGPKKPGIPRLLGSNCHT
jgi:hypothetical protein